MLYMIVKAPIAKIKLSCADIRYLIIIGTSTLSYSDCIHATIIWSIHIHDGANNRIVGHSELKL